ncbi:peptidase M14 [Yeosuana aromativorans]|uniref:Peptidase M14 n=1 Tax=Yeosuana aromativorans TaxID=288019 RepID=A0A8J3BKV8_9FLAO|nr:M14 metallopeptidase family protein [Yeosuana aromativorans]GGK28848.1 peptidase M14 [Yeosuana aromativorans]
MEIDILKALFEQYKEHRLSHRYITNDHIKPLISKLDDSAIIKTIGYSVKGKPIYAITIGRGQKRILMWSQMHGNESTTTKALFDVFNTLTSGNSIIEHIINTCTLYIIPILNPDGAEAYTRVNANTVDLNRDAQDLSQPESKVLRQAFLSFKPHFCYNLHGQRTIFSAGSSKNPATVSFLAPAQDEQCTVTDNRKVAMEIIGVMNTMLQTLIPNQVGVYDDAFNINCVGDTFQSENVPTMLFEAGHFPNDYGRDTTREFIYYSMLESLDYISKNDIDGRYHESYFEIPENDKCFFDIIIRKANINPGTQDDFKDIGILYQETLKNGKIEFIPKIEKIDNLSGFFGHREINAQEHEVVTEDETDLETGSEIVFVTINNKKISLLLK